MNDATSLTRALDLEHERVHVISDPRIGLHAVVAVHSTVLGPALGGLRVRDYAGGVAEGLEDALRLSRAMTLKAAANGLDLGGGKAVIVDDGNDELRTARLVAVAQEIERLGGAYITAEDIGTTTEDMDLVACHTRFVVGRSQQDDVGGDPSPFTARTVFNAMSVALEAAGEAPTVRGRSVGVLGLGKVGEPLVEMLLDAGASVVGYDPRPEVCARLGGRGMAIADSASAVLQASVDVLAPCAAGGMIDRDLALEVPCRIVCGAANNPLADDGAEAVLADRGIVYVPDFLSNCGGLVYAEAQWRGGDRESVDAALTRASLNLAAVLATARDSGALPGSVAADLALKRIAGVAA